jgi:DNA-directed RNA polymerase specialized sigma24 family protein
VSTDPLNSLIEKLNSGDAEAIQQALIAHEAILRMMVRRQLSNWLRAKFDSIDIVHSVWAHLLPGLRAGRWHFSDANELRAFLIKVTRNRLVNRIHHAALELDHARAQANQGEAGPGGPPPDEAVAEEEVWQQLLDLCPPAHHELLRLKREGVPLHQIAAQTGLHKSSVRRVLYDLLRRFMARRQMPGPAPQST